MLHVYELDHLVLNVADVDRALTFYVDGLGLQAERRAEYEKGDVPFPSVRLNGHTIVDLFPPKLHGNESAHGTNLNHFCLVVSERIEEISRHLESIGAPVDRGPVRGFGALGTGTSFYTRDPDGNVIELRTYVE